VVVNDFNLSLAPNSATVVAGQAATYNATVSPSAATGFPNSVALACSGLPTGATCSVANGSITNLNSGPQSRAIVVNTTMRTTTTVELRKRGPIFASWFPLSGLAFLGLGTSDWRLLCPDVPTGGMWLQQLEHHNHDRHSSWNIYLYSDGNFGERDPYSDCNHNGAIEDFSAQLR
jgi:hypothetical protein